VREVVTFSIEYCDVFIPMASWPITSYWIGEECGFHMVVVKTSSAMRIGLLFVAAILSGVFVGHTQEDLTERELRLPPAAEYEQLIKRLLAETPLNEDALRFVIDELQRNLPQYSRADILSTYDQLMANDSIGFWVDQRLWMPSVLEDQLQSVELPPNPSFPYPISENTVIESVTPADFQGDGIPELIVQVSREWPSADRSGYRYRFEGFFTLHEGEAGVIHVSSTPLPYNLLPTVHWATQRFTSLVLTDLNADDSPEWVVMTSSTNTGWGIGSWSNGLFVLTWDGTQLITISPDNWGAVTYDPGDVHLNYLNVDEDPALEIEERSSHSNSWGCHFEAVTLLDWSPTDASYVLAEGRDEYPGTPNCQLMHAEQAMWQGDYAAAIPLYEQALSGMGEVLPETDAEMWQYAQLRLALAYALTDQSEQANSMFEDLSNAVPASTGMEGLITTAAQHYLPGHDAIALCSALHDFFPPSEDDITVLGFYVGRTLVDTEQLAINVTDGPDPQSAGCDVDRFIESRLRSIPFTDLPIEVMAAEGVGIRDSIVFDLNEDGIQDWVVWVDARIQPFAFISDVATAQYKVSRPPLPNELDGLTHDWVELPGNVGIALVWISPELPFDYYYGYYPMCASDREQTGSLMVRGAQEGQLGLVLYTTACLSLAPSEMFSDDARTVSTGTGIEDDGMLVEDTFVWSAEEQRYRRAGEAAAYEDAYFDSRSEDVVSDLRNTLYGLRSELQSGTLTSDQFAVVEPQLVAAIPGLEPELEYQRQYLRAAALEVLGRSEEAIEQYTALSQSAPETIWGQLATLHIPLPDR
jgi:hypothetical protein